VRITAAPSGHHSGKRPVGGRALNACRPDHRLKLLLYVSRDRESHCDDVRRRQRREKRSATKELEMQVMETKKRVLGEEHPSTLTSMDNLASTF
jgi:hypothetical protein